MKQFCCYLLLCSFCIPALALPWSQFNQAKNYEGSSDLVDLQYHMGPVLSAPINLYIIWYGHWKPTQQAIIRDFLYSLSSSSASYPSVADWWRTVRLYTDQTGSNITGNIVLSGEFYDSAYSNGGYLSRLAIQSIIRTAVTSSPRALPLNTHNGLYLVLTSSDVRVQDFCRAVCGFHYFTFPTIVGATVPYAWIGYSGTQCPGMCAYPFAWPNYSGKPPPSTNGGNNILRAPNGDVGAEGMVSVIAHELAEVSSNPLVNAWYAGDDPTAPTEIADLCMGVYGTGGGGGYPGKVNRDSWGNGYNVNGVKGRKFLVQWIWNPVKRRCSGPNAID
ncbi:Protein EXORDIUM-like [Quillaja saponaria]|uniref:Protein EXORDIUM-like n=1 Tax=Quillaja saponaria TaxID=32244 RepID=A0AAD7PWF4_QUISA|nr:Protein EXORDIUM-like [Quillaja saponaria]